MLRSGRAVHDEGDLPVQVWRPDHQRPLAQNLDQVVASVQQLRDRIEPLFRRGDDVLVLGGNCTVVLGVLAALHRIEPAPPGLLYLDRGYDLNVPSSTTDGALDWMGMAHALDLPGALDELAGAFDIRPLVTASQVAWLGVDDDMATEWERQQVAHLDSAVYSSRALAEHPAATATEALAAVRAGVLAVHLDVDVLDFTDAPLAENTDGRNTGPTLAQAAIALSTAVSDPRFRVLSVGELNPTRSAGDPEVLTHFCRTLTEVLTSI